MNRRVGQWIDPKSGRICWLKKKYRSDPKIYGYPAKIRTSHKTKRLDKFGHN